LDRQYPPKSAAIRVRSVAIELQVGKDCIDILARTRLHQILLWRIF
jgi:hypothetical protein